MRVTEWCSTPVTDLAQLPCVPCKGGVPPLDTASAEGLLRRLGNGWCIRSGDHAELHKSYRFKNFRDALAFVNRVGALAEEVGHHPDVYLAWGRVTLTVWTHKIGGLSESDFIFAAKCEELA